MSRLLVLLVLVLAQCAPPPPPTGQARADAAVLSACREHADQVYNRTRRDTIYTISTRDSPFSANDTSTGVVDRGLAQRYGHENMVRDCVRNTGTSHALTWPASPPSRASLPNAMRASSTPAASPAGPDRGCNGWRPTGWPGN